MKVGLACGTFDPLHLGHLRLLRRARALCDKLVVAVNANDLVQLRKGRPERFPLAERMAALRDLRTVDVVCEQSRVITKSMLVAEHAVTMMIVGDDWTPDTYDGEGLGVPVIYLPRTEGVSSTQLMNDKAVRPCQ